MSNVNNKVVGLFNSLPMGGIKANRGFWNPESGKYSVLIDRDALSIDPEGFKYTKDGVEVVKPTVRFSFTVADGPNNGRRFSDERLIFNSDTGALSDGAREMYERDLGRYLGNFNTLLGYETEPGMGFGDILALIQERLDAIPEGEAIAGEVQVSKSKKPNKGGFYTTRVFLNSIESPA